MSSASRARRRGPPPGPAPRRAPRRDLAVPEREHLDDEERVAAGEAVQLVGVESCPRPAAHAVGGEWRQVDAPGGALAGQLAERDAQCVGRRQRVVAEVTSSSTGRSRSRRPRKRSRSRVASSAHCTSSTTRPSTASPCWSTASKISSREPAPRTISSRPPPISRAMSCSGARGRGVNRLSQAPQAQVASGSRCWSSSTSEDLPTPASPEIRTRRPSPDRASAAYATRASTWKWRSNRLLRPIVHRQRDRIVAPVTRQPEPRKTLQHKQIGGRGLLLAKGSTTRVDICSNSVSRPRRRP